MQPDTKCVRVRIEGRVQGIGYRAWTCHTALKLGLNGWVRNRRDGSVEAVFQGTADTIERMLALCREGPPAAHILKIDVEDCGEGSFRGFEQRPTV